jgi:uncharacterized protein YjiS (DUF1127 family)
MFLLNLLASARNAMAEWRRRERAYGQLMALDDRSLADIGIRRSEIASLVHGVHGSAWSAGSTRKPQAAENATPEAARAF